MSFTNDLHARVAELRGSAGLSVPLTGAACADGGRVLVRLVINGRMLPAGVFELRADGTLHELGTAAGCGDGD